VLLRPRGRGGRFRKNESPLTDDAPKSSTHYADTRSLRSG
jgi:hypothetical protein